MKKITLSICLTMATLILLAQPPHDPSTGPSQGNGTGIFLGKITDSTGKPVEDASVILMKMTFDPVTQTNKGKLFKGVTTKTKGEFTIDDIPFAQPFQLKITAQGFITVTQFVVLKTGAAITDLGNFKLADNIKQLAEVKIKVTQKLLKMEADRLSFNVEKNMVTTGGTALDVMRYIPSVQTDIDGNVKLRNANPQIFIDGRPTTLSLDQIPADAIESVEVITNPSAKYDASGGNAGIINLILKKNKKSGYNGNLRGGVDKRGSVNGGGDFNSRQGKFNISAAFNAMKFKNYTDGKTAQFNAFLNPHEQVNQTNSTKAFTSVLFGKLGIDYFVSNKTTLSANVVRVNRKFRTEDFILADIVAGNTKKYATRNSNSKRAFSPIGLSAGLKHRFAKEGREITADATYFSGDNTFNSFFTTDSANAAHTVYFTEQQKLKASGYFRYVTVQTDYTTPVGKSAKLEAGLRVSKKQFGNLNETNININNGGFVNLPNAGSNYKNKDNVYAAYTVFSNTVKTLSYQVGLRAESSDYLGTITATGEKFSYKNTLDLFPSAFLTKKLNHDQQLQLNYSRRINRPTFFNLTPLTDRTDPLNYSRGNPDLIPEFTGSVNMSYYKIFKNKNSFLFSAYYKKTNHLITRFQQKEFDPVVGKEVLINTYINANEAQNYGMEFTTVAGVTKWWDITANINGYKSEINTSGTGAQQQESFLSWFGKLNNNFKLPKDYTIQLSGYYQSKSSLPVGTPVDGGHIAQALTAAQGYVKAFYAVDIAFRKSFLKNNAGAVIFNINDIFRSRWQRQHSENSYFTQDYTRIQDPQMMRLTLSYRFGKTDMSLFKRKNMKGESESIQGALQ